MTKGTNTDSVMTSWSIFNCAKFSSVCPMRLAGTCTIYSKKAIAQLIKAATYQGLDTKSRKCAYQAMVMKTLETISNKTV